MPVVAYEYQIDYAHDPDGTQFPRLSFQIAKASQPNVTVDINAYLDSGAERSIVSGRIGAILGIDVLSRRQLTYQTTTGSRLLATLHTMRLTHPDLGSFDLEIGFSAIVCDKTLSVLIWV